jgi:hypothetical protein
VVCGCIPLRHKYKYSDSLNGLGKHSVGAEFEGHSAVTILPQAGLSYNHLLDSRLHITRTDRDTQLLILFIAENPMGAYQDSAENSEPADGSTLQTQQWHCPPIRATDNSQPPQDV